MKITQVQIKNFLKTKLATNDKWAKNALLKIYEKQTQVEKQSGTTHEFNGVGFSGTDGFILSSFAQQLIKFDRLSEKQMSIVFKKIPKYWKQIKSISDEIKLTSCVEKELAQ